MNFSFAEYRTVVSIVKTQNKPRWSATRLEQWKCPPGRSKEWDRSNQNLSPRLANFQYSTNFQLPYLLVGVFFLQANTHLAFLNPDENNQNMSNVLEFQNDFTHFEIQAHWTYFGYFHLDLD
jgi:hypothetical protein